MADAEDTLFLVGPTFEQLDPKDILVTPTGQTQTTLAQALADAGGTVVEVDIAGGPFLTAGTITTTGTVLSSSASLTAHGVLIGQGVSAVAATAALGNAQLLVGQTAANPSPRTVSGDVTMDNTGAFALIESGVTAGTYGDGSHVSRVQIDAAGRVLAASSVAINGTITPQSLDGILFADQFASINAAIAALPSTGGMIILPPNTTYLINAPADRIICTKNNVTLWAPSWNTIIQRGAGLAAAFDMISMSGTGDRAQGFTVDGNNVVHSGYEIRVNGANSTISDVQVINSRGAVCAGIQGDSSRIEKSYIVGVGSATNTIGIWAQNGDKVFIEGNRVENSGRAGITFNGSQSQCIGNYCLNCHEYAAEQGGVIVNYFQSDTSISDYGAVIVGNTIKGGGVNSDGIEVEHPSTIIANNTIDGIGVYGIIVFGTLAVGNVISNNVLRNTAQAVGVPGIYMDATPTDFIICGNHVFTDDGISQMTDAIQIAAGCTNFMITDNNLKKGTGVVIHDLSNVNAKIIKDNHGIDDVIISVPSGTIVTMPLNPTFLMSGSAAVGTIVSVNVPNGVVKNILPDGAVVFTGGSGNIHNSFTSTANVPFRATFDGGAWWLG
jgi:hypothetical protein